MKAQDRLYAARLATEDGRFEEALEGHLWFHHHALEESYSLRGVRLSFALSYWSELNDRYPPARVAMIEERDRNSEALLAGVQERQLFIDLEALNQTLKDDEHTCRVFLHLEANAPEFAMQCARLAIPTLVRCGDYATARRYLPDPEPEIREQTLELNKDILRAEKQENRERGAAQLNAFIHIWASNVSCVAAILAACGEAERAETLIAEGLAGVEDESIRATVAMLVAQMQSGEIPRVG